MDKSKEERLARKGDEVEGDGAMEGRETAVRTRMESAGMEISMKGGGKSVGVDGAY